MIEMVVERDGCVFMHVFLPFVMNDETPVAQMLVGGICHWVQTE